jgi:hypothetical protein
MSHPVIHGGGEPAVANITDAVGGVEIQPRDENRRYLEFINDVAGNRVHLVFSDEHDPTFGLGIYLDPGAVYTMTTDNLCHCRIAGICDVGLTSTIFIQVGH